MFTLLTKKNPNQNNYTKKKTTSLQAKKSVKPNYGSPLQMKNIADLDPNHFPGFAFDSSHYSDRAYALWQEQGAVPNLSQEESTRIYFAAVQEEKKRQLTRALSSTDPASHPETQQFISAMRNANSTLSDSQIDQIWQLILSGKREQEALNERARLKTDTPELKAMYNTEKDYLFTSDLDEIRNQNQAYKQLAEIAKPLLSTNNQKLALWSGGYDLSDYACRRGYVTLEGSTFGRILDSLYLSDKWNLIGPLWNIISKTFVKQYISEHGQEVHVFIRAYDPASVLVRQEVGEIYALDPGMRIRMKWHCIVQQGTDYYEIREDGTLAQTPDEDHSAFDESNCLTRLMRFFSSPQNKQTYGRAYNTMSRGFQSVLASDFSQIHEHISVSEFRARVQAESRQLWLIKGSPSQTPEEARQDYFNAERLVIESMKVTWCQNKAYEIWQRNGSRPDQSEQDMRMDYEQAEREFQDAVNRKIQEISRKHRDAFETRTLQKARLLWTQKGRPQQNQQQQDDDYYNAQQMVREEDARYEQNIPRYATLEILLHI